MWGGVSLAPEINLFPLSVLGDLILSNFGSLIVSNVLLGKQIYSRIDIPDGSPESYVVYDGIELVNAVRESEKSATVSKCSKI